ncbi:MAG TPA: gluconokinase [Candidatus Limnocylindrales bacterium]
MTDSSGEDVGRGGAEGSGAKARGEPPGATTTIVLMGVSGSGKSSVMRKLARGLEWPAAEGDAFHSPENVEKMRNGVPLTNGDRLPWLEALAAWIGERERAGENALVTCSALKREYRDRLRRGHPSVWFVHLVAGRSALAARVERRRGHYMPASLLTSQLDTLEPLAPDEPGITLSTEMSKARAIQVIVARMPRR